MSEITEKICRIANIDNSQVTKRLIGEIESVDLPNLLNGVANNEILSNLDILHSLVKTGDPLTKGDAEHEKDLGDLHKIVWNICLPILRTINPFANDGSTLKRQVLIQVCELLVECMRRAPLLSTQEVLKTVSNDLQKLCEEPEHLSPHFGTGHNHQTVESIKLACHVEFIRIFLVAGKEVCASANISQIFDELFTILLGTFPYLLEKVFSQIVSGGIFHLLRIEPKKKDTRLCLLWQKVENICQNSKKFGDKALLMFCSLADFFFPVFGDLPANDLRESDSFWKIVQCGLYSDNAVSRKRSLYLTKRLVDTCEKQGRNVNIDTNRCPLFLWRGEEQRELAKTWNDFILLVETLEEKQFHVIRPLFGRMQTLIQAASGDGTRCHLHTSWLVTVLCRCFQHESPQVVRWAVDTVLGLNLTLCPLIQQGQIQFLTVDFIGILQEMRLYQRGPGIEFGKCPPVGVGLQKFLTTCIEAQATQQEKAYFLTTLLEGVLSRTWGSIPLFYLTQALAVIPSTPIMSPHLLSRVKDVLVSLMTTLEVLPKGAIQCFLLQTVLHLTHSSGVSVEDMSAVVGMIERRECLQRGTTLWGEIVTWMKEALTQGGQWGSPQVQQVITSGMQGFLAETEGLSGSSTVTKLARLFVLSVDAGVYSGHGGEDKMTAVLLPATDVINSINSHVYMSSVKADRAISLMSAIAREHTPVSGETEEGGVQQAVCAMWQQLTVYVVRRTTQDLQEMEVLSLLELYRECLTVCAPYLSLSVGGPPLLTLTQTCVNTLKKAQTQTMQHRDEQLVVVSSLSLLAAITDVIKSRPVLDDTLAVTKLIKEYTAQMPLISVFHKLPPAGNKGDGVTQKDWGRVVSQYICSQWQCVHFALLTSDALPPPAQLTRLCHDALDVGTRNSNIHVLQCAHLLLPKLVGSEQELVCDTIHLAWSKTQEEINTASYWGKLELFVALICQPALLLTSPDSPVNACLREHLSLLFDLGREKMGVVNLVMENLFPILVSDSGIQVAGNFIPMLVEALVFGEIHKRTDRLVLELTSYIEGHGDALSVNEVMPRTSKNDGIVRVHMINFLCRLDPQEQCHVHLALSLAEELYSKYNALLEAADYRHYNNSLCHRQKNRIFQALCVLEPFMSPGSGQTELWQFVWHCLVVEGHPSVRHMQEWIVMKQVYRYPQLVSKLWQHFGSFNDKRNLSLCSLMHILSRLGPHMPAESQSEFYSQALTELLPWCLAHHFNTRVHAQASLAILWSQCRDLGHTDLLAKHSILQTIITFHADNNNSTKNLNKLINNYFYQTFDFLEDLSLETLFLTLPRLAMLTDEEWIEPAVFELWDPTWSESPSSKLLPVYNPNTRLRECSPGPWKIKPPVDTDQDDVVTEGDVQKKIMPWRLMTPEEEGDGDISGRKLHRPGGMIIVTSLINKIPNLGGLCRTCEIFGVSEFVVGSLCFVEDKVFQSLSVTAQNWIPITEVVEHRLLEFLEAKRRDGYTLVGAEQTANSVCLTKYSFPAKTLLLLGNEKEGIPVQLIQMLDACVEIPQQGVIRSLNVHVSGALLVWEYARQQMNSDAGGNT